MAREFVPIFYDWLEVTKDLTAEEKGNLIDNLILFYRWREGKDDIDFMLWVDLDNETEKVMHCIVRKISAFLNLKDSRPAGEFHWNWKGGITPVNQRERSSRKYAEWRKAVFSRDNFTCQICGQVGGCLQAHHIKRWSTNVNERYQLSNGVTLCKECHKALHKKGG